MSVLNRVDDEEGAGPQVASLVSSGEAITLVRDLAVECVNNARMFIDSEEINGVKMRYDSRVPITNTEGVTS